MSPIRRNLSLAVLSAAVLLIAIDSTVLSLAIPALARDLEPTADQVLWIGDIYSFAIAGLLVTMGSVADRIGRKRLLLIGAAAFGLASVLAAFAPTAEVLIAARLLLGVAGSTLMPSTLSLIRNIFTVDRERTRAIAIWSAAASAGIALGPVVGGFLLEHFWWGSVFLINVPIMIVLLAVGAWVLPESRDPHPQPIDLLSSLLSFVAIVPIVYAIKQLAGGEAGIAAIVATVVGLAAGWAFVRRQRRLANPLIDVTLFQNASFSGAVIVNFVSVFALSGVLFFFSQYLQLARGLGTLAAGLSELPAAAASLLAVFAVGILLGRLGRGRAIALALAISAVGLAAAGILLDAVHLSFVLAALVPLGFGIGVSQTLSVDAVVSAAPPEKSGAASSISETAYELGAAMGIALLGSIMTAVYRFALPDGASATVHDSLASASTELAAGSPMLAAAQESFVVAMQSTAIIAAVVLAAGAVVAYALIPSDRTAEVEA